MLPALLLLVAQPKDLPTLADVEAKVRTLPGVELESEMVSPSVVPIRFKVSPDGLFWAKYPSSEDFVDRESRTTWMPDRREYATQKSTEGNPVPVGFDAMWGGASTYRQTGETSAERFHEKDCYRIPCKGSGDYTINLFVERDTLMPQRYSGDL